MHSPSSISWSDVNIALSIVLVLNYEPVSIWVPLKGSRDQVYFVRGTKASSPKADERPCLSHFLDLVAKLTPLGVWDRKTPCQFDYLHWPFCLFVDLFENNILSEFHGARKGCSTRYILELAVQSTL